MPGAGSELPARLDLAPLADMAAKTRDVLVVHVVDVIDAERTDLAPRSVPPPTRPPPARAATWSTASAVTFGAFALRPTEPGARPPSAFTIAPGSC